MRPPQQPFPERGQPFRDEETETSGNPFNDGGSSANEGELLDAVPDTEESEAQDVDD